MYKILVIDDDKVNRMVIERMLLKEEHYQITSVQSAYEALDALHITESQGSYKLSKLGITFDLILSDIMMPGMDGFELCQIIRSFQELDNLPIIMITGANNEEFINTSFEKGANDYINKPIVLKELLARTKSAIHLKVEREKKIQRDLELIHDLNLAKIVQTNSLPPNFSDETVAIKGFYKPYSFLGGDFYYWKALGEKKYCVILLDVMGHGVATSLITMYLRSTLVDAINDFQSLEALVLKLQQVMDVLNAHEDYMNHYYFTALGLLVDMASKDLSYFNCGHPRAMMVTKDNDLEYLESTMSPVGLLNTKPVVNHMDLHKVREIYLYTDGIKDEVLDKIGIDHTFSSLDDVRNVIKDSDWNYIVNYASSILGEDDLTLLNISIKENQ